MLGANVVPMKESNNVELILNFIEKTQLKACIILNVLLLRVLL